MTEATGGTEAQLRASDVDRDRAIEVLNNSLVIGQLTADEHDRRVQDALSAKTIHDLDALLSDLQSSHRVTKTSRYRGWLVVAVCTFAAIGVSLLLLLGGSNPSTYSKPSGSTETSWKSNTSPNGGFVSPQPQIAGRFCQAMEANHAKDPSSNPGAITPEYDAWHGSLVLGPGASVASEEDLTAVTSVEDATLVVQGAWQANGYQYRDVTVPCLNAYDSSFHWVGAGTSSTSPTTVSTSFVDRHSLLAVRSLSGKCWYALNVMYSGDPIIQSDGLQTYGGFFPSSSGPSCTVDAAPGYDLWQRGDPSIAGLQDG